jgi:hypothetical protein
MLIKLINTTFELKKEDFHNFLKPNGDCKDDHGERSNNKLRDQPFYQRARNGKMRKH